MNVALDEDFHVHSTFSDGASTLAENVELALVADHQFLASRVAARRDGRGEREVVLPVGPHRRGMADAGVRLVAGSDSHHCRDIGVYDSVRAPQAPWRGPDCGGS